FSLCEGLRLVNPRARPPPRPQCSPEFSIRRATTRTIGLRLECSVKLVSWRLDSGFIASGLGPIPSRCKGGPSGLRPKLRRAGDALTTCPEPTRRSCQSIASNRLSKRSQAQVPPSELPHEEAAAPGGLTLPPRAPPGCPPAG